ncbi:hypothetical protein Hanom_Chr08g00754551 [Helianthus anomalus]
MFFATIQDQTLDSLLLHRRSVSCGSPLASFLLLKVCFIYEQQQQSIFIIFVLIKSIIISFTHHLQQSIIALLIRLQF